jgi:uncharacterized membrane protein YhaH (DUF805 family)
MDWTNFLFSFQGRLNRGKYWLAGFLYIAVWLVFFAISLTLLGDRVDNLLSFAGVGLALWLIGIVLLLVTCWSGFAVGVKRLHDRDKTGWWIVLFYLAPSVLSGAQASGSGGGAMLLMVASFVISVWSFIELGCLRGTRGPNRYGPDPLGSLSNEPLR